MAVANKLLQNLGLIRQIFCTTKIGYNYGGLIKF